MIIPINDIHESCSFHRKMIINSDICGCFFCRRTFTSNKIKYWVDENSKGIGQTALCPNCGIDAVIGSQIGYEINNELLEIMHKEYFGITFETRDYK